jgi:hypothetical protein
VLLAASIFLLVAAFIALRAPNTRGAAAADGLEPVAEPAPS